MRLAAACTLLALAATASAGQFAFDTGRGLIYRNVDETAETVAVDVRRHEIVARWKSGCDAPRGLALDEERGFLFVACAARVVSLDVKDGGRILGTIDTGEGLDDVDYSPPRRRLYAAAPKSATITVIFVTPWGRLERVATIASAEGAR